MRLRLLLVSRKIKMAILKCSPRKELDLSLKLGYKIHRTKIL
jgi:hypothetical protein